MKKLYTVSIDNDVATLKFDLPQGKTQAELTEAVTEQIRETIEDGVLYGKKVRIFGRTTTAMCLALGHELAHVCKEVSIFDPKEGEYVLCVKH